jgi:hypothetical protein
MVVYTSLVPVPSTVSEEYNNDPDGAIVLLGAQRSASSAWVIPSGTFLEQTMTAISWSTYLTQDTWTSTPLTILVLETLGPFTSCMGLYHA